MVASQNGQWMIGRAPRYPSPWALAFPPALPAFHLPGKAASARMGRDLKSRELGGT